MSAWATLLLGCSVGAAWTPDDGEDMPEARATLTANLYVPFLWPALFDEADARTYDVGDPDDVESWVSFALVTDVPSARERVAELAAAAEVDPWASALWESLEPVAALLDDLPDDSQVVLDPHEVDAMGEEGELLLAMATTTRALARLRKTWSEELARALMPDECREGVEQASAFAQHFTGHDDDREALFVLCFGWPTYDEATMARLAPWMLGEPMEEDDPDSRDPVGQARSFVALLTETEAIELGDADKLAHTLALPLLGPEDDRANVIYEALMDSPHVEDVFISEEELEQILSRW